MMVVGSRQRGRLLWQRPRAVRDIALLQITNPRSAAAVKLASEVIPAGTSAGSVGFTLARTTSTERGWTFVPTLRFQGGFISACPSLPTSSGPGLPLYETDTLLYTGSNGCPGFLLDSRVFGMHLASMREEPASAGEGQIGPRAAFSLWLPSSEILRFVESNGVSTCA
jgi:hypothetical protein